MSRKNIEVRIEQYEKTVTELIWHYETYIELLLEELNETVMIADIHGWKSTRVEAGEQFRKRIKKLRQELCELRKRHETNEPQEY